MAGLQIMVGVERSAGVPRVWRLMRPPFVLIASLGTLFQIPTSAPTDDGNRALVEQGNALRGPGHLERQRLAGPILLVPRRLQGVPTAMGEDAWVSAVSRRTPPGRSLNPGRSCSWRAPVLGSRGRVNKTSPPAPRRFRRLCTRPPFAAARRFPLYPPSSPLPASAAPQHAIPSRRPSAQCPPTLHACGSTPHDLRLNSNSAPPVSAQRCIDF